MNEANRIKELAEEIRATAIRGNVEEITDPTADDITRLLGAAGIAWSGSSLDNTGGGVMNLFVEVAYNVRDDINADWFTVGVGAFDSDGESLDGFVGVYDCGNTASDATPGEGETYVVFDPTTMSHTTDKLSEILAGFVVLRDAREAMDPATAETVGVEVALTASELERLMHGWTETHGTFMDAVQDALAAKREVTG